MTIAELKEKNLTQLTKIARSLDLPGASALRKQDVIFKILQAQSEKEGHIFVFFFKQKTAYEFGLVIPAEPLFRSFGVITSHSIFYHEVMIESRVVGRLR